MMPDWRSVLMVIHPTLADVISEIRDEIEAIQDHLRAWEGDSSMQEIAVPGRGGPVFIQVGVEGPRALLRIGQYGDWVRLNAIKAQQLGEMLLKASNELDPNKVLRCWFCQQGDHGDCEGADDCRCIDCFGYGDEMAGPVTGEPRLAADRLTQGGGPTVPTPEVES